MSAKLFVGNLSFETTSDEIRDLFSEVGPVESCQVTSGPDGTEVRSVRSLPISWLRRELG